MRITEDGVWRYYNCPNPVWAAKCGACRVKVESGKTPVEECVNCWKVEIWRPSEAGYAAFIDNIMCQGIAVVAKQSRAPIQVVRTGHPPSSYPPHSTCNLLILYAKRIAERDALLNAARLAGSGSSHPEMGYPVRRGCWRYDGLLGPWETWYPPEQDWPFEGA